MNNLRYRKIRFKELDKGSDQKYFDKNNPNKINTSLGLVSDPKTGRLKLAEDFTKFTFGSNAKAYTYHSQISCPHSVSGSVRVFHLVYNSSQARTELLVSIGYSIPQYKANFGGTSTDAYMAASYRGLILVWYKDTVAPDIKQDWSDDDGGSFTNQTWAYEIPKGYKVTEDGTIYVWTLNEILKSIDGKTWTVFYDGSSSDEQIYDFDELDGELYAIISNFGSSINYFVKFDNDDNPLIIRDFSGDEINMVLKTFNNRIILADYSGGFVNLYEWDKSELNKIAFIERTTNTMHFAYVDDEFLVLIINRDELFKINTSNGVFEIATLNPGDISYINTVYKYNGNLCVSMSNITSTVFYVLAHRNDVSETKQATGKYYTPIIDVGRHIPTYIIVKHKPLGDDASVVVKAKSNQGASFSVTCINNITDDSVYKMAVLKDFLDEVDFIELEITLADSGLGGEIEDLEVIYIYQPTGLENSK